jgi:putative DNA methylase
MIEKDFDIPFIADLALREKQIQQNYRPVIAVHKWFARRPGTLFRGLILSEFVSKPLRSSFYESNQLTGLSIADPFMGGGTPLLEANRVGCSVIGFDINPMSYWVVKEEIEPIDLNAYRDASDALLSSLRSQVGHLYRTKCAICGSEEAEVKYFLYVKVSKCGSCGKDIDLFPGYLLAGDARHPKNVLVCSECGELTESENRRKPGKCIHCGSQLTTEGPARRNQCLCPHCGRLHQFPRSSSGAPRHRVFALEYHCFNCKKDHAGRFFKKADEEDLGKVKEAEKAYGQIDLAYAPDDDIPSGDETDRLHRWGYRKYREMFNSRQLLSLELSARFISDVKDVRLKRALITNFSDLLRYQNMLCRYDTMALKSLDIFSVHGFPVGLIQCESNFLGIVDKQRDACIGSGGWANIIEKYRKAKLYCEEPFEIRLNGRTKEVIKISGEWIGDRLKSHFPGKKRKVQIYCADSAKTRLPANILDAVLTDPPYFGNVQYAELMDFCYAWLRRLGPKPASVFNRPTTRNRAELTGNENMGRGLEHFAEGLSAAFQRMTAALKPGAPLVFTYHHNDIKSYLPVAVGILDSGLTCSASLPCPGEMGASIHISRTGSSIIDTVFVCRSTGKVPRNWVADSPSGLAEVIESDLEKLKAGNVNLSKGDIKCITYGHLIRLAVWFLRKNWDKNEPLAVRLQKVQTWLQDFGGWQAVENHMTSHGQVPEATKTQMAFALQEPATDYGDQNAEISF